MQIAAVTCSYTFTDAEYRKSLNCFYNDAARSGRLFWLGVTLVFLALINYGLYLEYKDGELSDAQGHLKWLDILNAQMPFGLALVLQLLLIFTPLYAFLFQWYFRGSANRNKLHHFTISAEKIAERTDTFDSSFQWTALIGGRENNWGFLIMAGKRHFYWLPKHGFASVEDIDRCRLILQEHLKDFKPTRP